jgi:hypothetical protein
MNLKDKLRSVGDHGTGLFEDHLFDFSKLRSVVKDLVQLSLLAYLENPKVGTDQDPVMVVVYSLFLKKRVTHHYQCPASSYSECFDKSFDVASNVLRVYGRGYLLVFPDSEKYLSERELVHSLFHWTMLALEDKWVPELKNRLLTSFSRAEGQPEPEYRTPHHRTLVFLGTFGKIAYRDVSRSGRDGLLWRNTVLHGLKKAMPTVSENFIYNALKDHGALLSQESDSTPEFLRVVEEVSDIIFKDVRYTPPTFGHKVSQNACVCRTKQEGGSFYELVNRTPLRRISDGWHGILIAMSYCPRRGVVEVRTNQYDAPLLDRNLLATGETQWKVEIIREPLKVRTITKGEHQRNGAWSDIQQQLWTSLQRFDCFQLTRGVPVQDAIRWLGPLENPLHDWHWVSGDYKAATDSIHGDVMEASIHGIKDPLLLNLLVENLSRGRIEYEDICNRLRVPVIDPVIQQRGQLMGSIFSFPLLCVINLCTWLMTSLRFYRHVYTPDSRNLEELIRDAPVLINGDDILFRSPSRRFTDVWEYYASCAGFRLSVGKTYYSKKFAIVNSTYYSEYSQSVIPYVNMGILYGKKKGDGDSRLAPTSVREKMASLPGYFRDLWKHFDDRDSVLRNRIAEFAFRCRRDVRWSGWSREILGLVDLDKRHNYLDYLRDYYKLHCNGPESGKTPSALRTLFWSDRKEIDTSVLYRKSSYKSKAPPLAQRVSLMIKEYWSERVQGETDLWWARSVAHLYKGRLIPRG